MSKVTSCSCSCRVVLGGEVDDIVRGPVIGHGAYGDVYSGTTHLHRPFYSWRDVFSSSTIVSYDFAGVILSTAYTDDDDDNNDDDDGTGVLKNGRRVAIKELRTSQDIEVGRCFVSC
jgi:hypothetical protein